VLAYPWRLAGLRVPESLEVILLLLLMYRVQDLFVVITPNFVKSVRVLRAKGLIFVSRKEVILSVSELLCDCAEIFLQPPRRLRVCDWRRFWRWRRLAASFAATELELKDATLNCERENADFVASEVTSELKEVSYGVEVSESKLQVDCSNVDREFAPEEIS